MSIKVENLTYIYSPGLPGETLALDDISFEVEDGEFIGIIGHTGSGKSTLLQQLNGLLKPTSGNVYINGQCITDGKTKLVEIRRKVGLVFQYPEYQLFEETVAKDVAYGPKNLGCDEKEIDERVRQAIADVGLDYDQVANQSPFNLSGGQKRRVAIAGVIAMHPDVLILDEPTAGLDPKAHKEILSMIRNIHKNDGLTTILVSHNMADIASLSDRVFVIENGRLMLEGTPEYVFAHVDMLENVGLNVPPVTQIMHMLHKRIPQIREDVFSVDDAAENIACYIEDKCAHKG